MERGSRKAYPSDVSDDGWAFIAPYLALVREGAARRDHPLREAYDGLRWVVRAGRAGGRCRTTCRRGRGIGLEVVEHAEAKRGFVLPSRRWVAERGFAWLARFRRPARDYERLPQAPAGLHFVAFACLMFARVDRLRQAERRNRDGWSSSRNRVAASKEPRRSGSGEGGRASRTGRLLLLRALMVLERPPAESKREPL